MTPNQTVTANTANPWPERLEFVGGRYCGHVVALPVGGEAQGNSEYVRLERRSKAGHVIMTTREAVGLFADK